MAIPTPRKVLRDSADNFADGPSPRDMWALHTRLVFPTDGTPLKLKTQEPPVQHLITKGLYLANLCVTTSEPWPERTTPMALTHQYLIAAAKSLGLENSDPALHNRVHTDQGFSLAISGLVSEFSHVWLRTNTLHKFMNRVSMNRLKARHMATAIIEDEHADPYFFRTLSNSSRTAFVRFLRNQDSFIYPINFDTVSLIYVISQVSFLMSFKKKIDRSKPFLNPTIITLLSRLAFDGGDESMYRKHPELFVAPDDPKRNEFSGNMIGFAAVAVRFLLSVFSPCS